MTDRRAYPGQFYQGVDEEIAYTVNVGKWATAPTATCVVAKLDGTDVSASVLSGNPSISGSLITTGCLTSLSAGEDYKVEVKFAQGGQIWECYFFVTGEV